MKKISWFWDLICMIYWFLNCFCHENSNKFKKSSFERKNQLNNAFTMHIWKKHELNMQLNMNSFHIGFRVGPMAQTTLVYLWRKVACFVLLSLWDLPNWGISNCILHVFGQLSTRRGALSWFHDVWTCGAEVLEYWTIYSLKIKLIHKWKFQKNWDVPLVLLERSWWAGFNGISFVRFGLRMPEILNFKWFLSLKIQINHKKQGFGRKNQMRMWSHLKNYHSIQVWELGCAFGIVEKILMNGI